MRISNLGKKLVVITAGDPSGIGPEVILKSIAAFASGKRFTTPWSRKAEFTPLIIGDYGVFLRNAAILEIDISSIKPQPFENFNTRKDAVNFIDLKNIPIKSFRFGALNKLYGRASMEYLSRGVSIVKRAKGATLVTGPINKASINKAGFKFGGHTEFLSRLTGSRKVTMMLVGGPLKVSLVTRHVPLKEVTKHLTRAQIVQTVENTYYGLKTFFKIRHPKIGIAALNPHAGEGALFGREEKSIIIPAVDYLRKKIEGIAGPSPSDTLFYKAYKGELDCVVCMYHDQGLIPLKMVAFDKGVNLSLGLPFIRTSPDHGTGFDIAGKGKANPSSMIEAIKLAVTLSCGC